MSRVFARTGRLNWLVEVGCVFCRCGVDLGQSVQALVWRCHVAAAKYIRSRMLIDCTRGE